MDPILIADSGSTKTDWALGKLRLKTQGINPIHQDDEAILSILRQELLPNLKSQTSNLKPQISNLNSQIPKPSVSTAAACAPTRRSACSVC